MDFILAVLKNQLLIAAIISQGTAQILKTIIYAVINKEIRWDRLYGDGGMPSGHSATMASLATGSALLYGLDSFQFAVTSVVAFIVMHDATSVRYETGKQAALLNQLVKSLALTGESHRLAKNLKEFVGHTPLQVAFGALLGIGIALLVVR